MGADEYSKQIVRTISSCKYIAEPERCFLEIRVHSGRALFWEHQFELIDGSMLEVRESIEYRQDHMVGKDYRFSLRDKANLLIFRFDAHGVQQDADDPCHVHVGSEDNVVEFGTVKAMDLPAFMHCLKNYFCNKPQPWETQYE